MLISKEDVLNIIDGKIKENNKENKSNKDLYIIEEQIQAIEETDIFNTDVYWKNKFENKEKAELEYYNKVHKIARTYGYEAQSRQLIEEMAECTVAINKLWRTQKTEIEEDEFLSAIKELSGLSGIVEELADVQIMVSQLLYLIGKKEEVEKMINMKLKRQINKIENQGNECNPSACEEGIEKWTKKEAE